MVEISQRLYALKMSPQRHGDQKVHNQKPQVHFLENGQLEECQVYSHYYELVHESITAD